MVYIAKKKVKGKTYLYLTKKERVDGKPRVTWQKYLGPEDSIHKMEKNIDAFRKKTEFEIKDFGLPMALLTYAERLRIVDIVNSKTEKRSQGLSVGEYLLIASLNRCIKPTSKAKIKKWFDGTYFEKKFPEINTYLDSNAYTNHFKYLDEGIIEEIEAELHKILISEFQLEMNSLFYDPTNFHTFINPKGQELPKHGKSKEGRHTLNLVGLSIFCTQDGGVPIMQKTYPGNVMDAKLFKSEFPRFIERLKIIRLDSSKTTLVFDKGNISENVFKEIDKSNIGFICTIRPSTQKQLHSLKGEDFEIFTLPNGKKVGLKEYGRYIFGNKYRMIVSFNPNQNSWNGSIKMEKILNKLVEINEFFGERLNTHKWREIKNVDTKIRKIIGKNDYLDYIDYSLNGDYGMLSLKIELNEEAIDEHIKTLGKSYYITNREDLTPMELIWLYRQQYTVEHVFKYLKMPNMLQIRPMFHYTDSSIRGHVFSVVLGLLLVTLLHRDVVKKFPKMSILEMLENLSQLKVIHIKSGNKVQNVLSGMNPASDKLANYLKLTKYL